MYSVLILFVFLFIISLSLTIYILSNFNKLEARRRLRTLAGQEKTYEAKEGTAKQKRGGGKSSLIRLIGKLMPLDKYLEDKKQLIIKARLLIKPEEFLSISIIAACTALMLMHLIFSNVLLDLVAMLAGFQVPLIYIRRIKKKRSNKLGDQLPDALNIISNGLRAGLSFVQAIMIAVLGGTSPDGGEGNVLGVLFAMFTMQFLATGMNFFQVTNVTYLKDIVWGGVLLIVMVVNYVTAMRRDKNALRKAF